MIQEYLFYDTNYITIRGDSQDILWEKNGLCHKKQDHTWMGNKHIYPQGKLDTYVQKMYNLHWFTRNKEIVWGKNTVDQQPLKALTSITLGNRFTHENGLFWNEGCAVRRQEWVIPGEVKHVMEWWWQTDVYIHWDIGQVHTVMNTTLRILSARYVKSIMFSKVRFYDLEVRAFHCTH